MSKFWEQQGEENFRDNPVELKDGKWQDVEEGGLPQPTNEERAARQEKVRQSKAAVEKLNDMSYLQDPERRAPLDALIEEIADEDDYSAVLADANLRIEQGTLYKMIMNHDLFQGLEVDPRAIANVQREIRKFARERMEIMLGMRQEAPKHAIVESPFNDLEVNILKKLASAATKGATETPQANQVAAQVAPKREGITPIGGGAKKPASPAPLKQLATATKPIARQPRPEAPAPVAEAQEYSSDKPIHEMSESELIQRNKEITAKRARKADNPQKAPMPSYDQEVMMQSSKVANMAPAVSAIVAALNNNKQ